jgi:hypothetical protein
MGLDYVTHEYNVVVASPYGSITYKAAEHLLFTLHWSREFDTVTQDIDYVNDTPYKTAGRINGFAHWTNRENDMLNFSTYYPKVVFIVTRLSDGKTEFYNDNVLFKLDD